MFMLFNLIFYILTLQFSGSLFCEKGDMIHLDHGSPNSETQFEIGGIHYARYKPEFMIYTYLFFILIIRVRVHLMI